MKTLRKLAAVWVATVAILAAVACSVDPGPLVVAAFALPERGLPAWVSIESAADCSEGCWRVGSLIYKDEGEAQNRHHIFARARDENQQWIEAEWHVAWADGDEYLTTKRPPDWGNFPMFACFSPDQGEEGPYWVYAGPDPERSDIIRGLGLPECLHVVYEVEFHWQEQVPMPPTATPVPCRTCRKFYLPLIGN